jgi:hypothetical protein
MRAKLNHTDTVKSEMDYKRHIGRSGKLKAGVGTGTSPQTTGRPGFASNVSTEYSG